MTSGGVKQMYMGDHFHHGSWCGIAFPFEQCLQDFHYQAHLSLQLTDLFLQCSMSLLKFFHNNLRHASSFKRMLENHLGR